MNGQNVFLFFAEKEGIPERWARQTNPAHLAWQSEHGFHFIMPGQPRQSGWAVRAPDILSSILCLLYHSLLNFEGHWTKKTVNNSLLRLHLKQICCIVLWMAKMFSSFLQKKKAFPSVGQDKPTLLTQLGNQNTGFISSCPVSHGKVAERLERRTCNFKTPSSSPALTASWICSRQSRVQILGHACK